MAVSIVSITRVNPAPCQHFVVTASVDGRIVTREVTPDEISNVDLDEAVLRIVKYYAIDKEQGLAGVVGKTVLPDALPTASLMARAMTTISTLWNS